MKKTKKNIFIFFSMTFAFFFLFSNLSSQQTAGELFEKALYMEEAKGDLQKAIELHKMILEKFTNNREIAAKAQLHIGLCYEKLGLKEAQKAYQNVVDNYPEQTEAVKVAKEKLSILLRSKAYVEKGEKDFKIRQVLAGPDAAFIRATFRGAPLLAATSPDGRYLSYTDMNTGNLIVLELATKKKCRLTENASLFKSGEIKGAFAPTWSPDSSRVAYTWINGKGWPNLKGVSELCTIGPDGSQRRVLYRTGEEAVIPIDWSPDGKQILAGFVSNFFKGKLTVKLGLISTTDGSVRVLEKSVESFLRMPRGILFSPDGSYIVYDNPPNKDTRAHDIFLSPIDGSPEMKLVEHPADDYVIGWASDGKRLLFASDRTGTLDLWVIRVADGKTQGEPDLIKKDVGQIKPLGFTKQDSLYYGIQNSMVDVYIATLDLEKSKLLNAPTKATQRFIGSNYDPKWSPDGKYLANISERVLGPRHLGSMVLCIRSPETGEEREFSPSLKKFGRLCRWSPDNRSIFVVGRDNKDRLGIFNVDVQTGDMIPALQFDPEDVVRYVTCPPDGKKLFYTYMGPPSHKKTSFIMMYDPVTKQEKEIYRDDSSYFRYLILSNDGRMLAFAAFGQGTALKIMPASGGEPREMLRLKKEESITTIAWTPDGKNLLFAKQKSNKPKCELWRISVEGGEPQKLGLAMDELNYLHVHPDGRRIAFSSTEKSYEILVMENFLPEDKRY